MAFQTVAEMLLHRLQSTPDKPAFRYPSGNGWARVTWRQFGEQVRAASMGLRALGLQNQQRVALLSGTRFEWVVADMAILSGGGATTTIYPSSTADDTEYIVNNSEAVMVFAENEDQVAKLRSVRAKLSQVHHVIVFDGQASSDGWVVTWAQLLEQGRSATQADWEAVCRSVKNEDIATLIYTSGTTGRPKGVILVHDCWVYEGEALEKQGQLLPTDVQLFWLPLAHVFGKMLEVAQLQLGFETAIDGRTEKIVSNCAEVKPTFIAAVPRIFEKAYNRIVENARQAGGAKWKIFKWAFEVGREVSRLRQQKKSPGPVLAVQYRLADRLVFQKIRAVFGGQLRFFVSGSAPLSREMSEFFDAAGVLIFEGYGLTETSAASTVSVPENCQFGTVGPPVPGTQVKIASDGEILIKGRGVMRGYYKMPEATAEALQDGWLHTGDIGEIDSAGRVRITDRKKDLIKTSGGKYVAPQHLEGTFKAMCPYVSQALVSGNNRNFVVMLVALDKDAVLAWAKENGVAGEYGTVVKDPRVHGLINGFVERFNASLASFEQIKKFAVLPRDLTEADGDLTPSLKLKRKVVEGKFKDLIDGFYAGSTAAI